MVLFGSAAGGTLRPTSDVNVLVLRTRFHHNAVDQLREPLQAAHAAIRLTPMFLLTEELNDVAKVFAQRFFDIPEALCRALRS
jgi:predicted nucleotidyltransferase